MVAKDRETGISVIGSVPWGSHLCVFFGTRQDLVDVLVSFFKEGLQNNEFCLCVTGGPAGKNEGVDAADIKIPDLSQKLETGQMKFIPYSSIYLKDGVFNGQKVFNTVAEISRQALEKGYFGIRSAGTPPWQGRKEWVKITGYEAELNKVVNQAKVMALCAYPLDKCGAREFIDVMSNHQYAFIVQGGEWISLKTKTLREMNRQLISGTTPALTPMQTRFAVSGLQGFKDEEIIELFLSLCSYSKYRQLALQLIKTFKNIRGLLAASTEDMQKAGLDFHCMSFIKLMKEIPIRVLKEKIEEKPVYQSPREIFDFLNYSMRDLTQEVFKVISLNRANQIIDVVNLFKGTADRITINATEIIGGAVAHDTKSLVFVHNHPSGDPTPSQADKQLTRDLVFVSSILQIRPLDHIIIGKNRYFSFADEGLIKEYDLDFLNLKLTGTNEAKRRLSEARQSMNK